MRRGGVGGEGRQVGNVCGEGGGLNIFFSGRNVHQACFLGQKNGREAAKITTPRL